MGEEVNLLTCGVLAQVAPELADSQVLHVDVDLQPKCFVFVVKDGTFRKFRAGQLKRVSSLDRGFESIICTCVACVVQQFCIYVNNNFALFGNWNAKFGWTINGNTLHWLSDIVTTSGQVIR